MGFVAKTLSQKNGSNVAFEQEVGYILIWVSTYSAYRGDCHAYVGQSLVCFESFMEEDPKIYFYLIGYFGRPIMDKVFVSCSIRIVIIHTPQLFGKVGVGRGCGENLICCEAPNTSILGLCLIIDDCTLYDLPYVRSQLFQSQASFILIFATVMLKSSFVSSPSTLCRMEGWYGIQ